MWTLDVDLKARYVSTEEILHALGIRLQSNVHTTQVSFGFSQFSVIAPWWDRSFDLALIVRTFIHGLGNYDTIQNEEDPPPPLVEGQLNLLLLTQILHKHSGLLECQQGQKDK